MKDPAASRIAGDIVGALLLARRFLQPDRVSADFRTITDDAGSWSS